MDYYKFCSSMLSSNCGFNKANSIKHLFDVESIARRRASGPRIMELQKTGRTNQRKVVV